MLRLIPKNSDELIPDISLHQGIPWSAVMTSVHLIRAGIASDRGIEAQNVGPSYRKENGCRTFVTAANNRDRRTGD